MSQQVRHSLIQVAVMMVIAAMGVLVEQQTDILGVLGVDPLWYPIVGAVLASAVRWFEGIRDAQRARIGALKPSDVGYNIIAQGDQGNGVAIVPLVD